MKILHAVLLLLALTLSGKGVASTPEKTLAQLLAPVLAQAQTRTVRIMMGGTSIAASEISNNQTFVNQLMALHGDARVATDRMGVRGGSWDLPSAGWFKQPYSGPSFVRLRGNSASQSLDNPGYGSQITVEYSKESDGGICQIMIDGALAGTINCQGPQQLSVRTVFQVPLGTHSVTFLPPVTGNVYLERVGFEQGLPGIAVIDATLGGSGLEHVYNNYPRGGQTVPGIPTQPGTGVAAYFQRADMDLVIWSGPVNDHDGFNPGIDTWKARMDEMVEATRGHCPLVLIAEMGGHLADPNDYAHPIYQAQYQYLLQLGSSNSHVFTLDWHGATFVPNIANYVAAYYPNAVLNTTTGQYGGDFIHPNLTAHRVALGMLCSSASIPVPVEDSCIILRNRSRNSNPLPAEASVSFLDGGVTRSGVTTVTGASAYAGPSLADTLPLIFSSEVQNLSTINAQVAASPSSDKYGKYLNYNNQVWLPIFSNALPGEKVTVTALVKSPQPYLFAAFQHPYLAPVLSHGTASLGTKTITVTYDTDEPPLWMTFEYQCDTNPNINFAGRLYSLSVTRTNGRPVSSFRPQYTRAAILQTTAPDGLTGTGATLHATANPQSDGAMSVFFEYGTDENLAGARRTLNTILPNGGATSPILINAGNLTPGRIYFYRAQATFSGTPEPISGAIQNFLAPPLGNPSAAIALKRRASGGVLLGMFGTPGQPYTLSASTNLTTWAPIATLTAGLGGNFNYEDVDASLFTRRCYRLTTP